MYQPKFKITNQILTNIGQIDAAKAIIDASPLIPAYEKEFRQEAVVRAVHYGTKLEGNDLTYTEVARVIDGQKVIAQERDVQEVINYRNVIKYLEELSVTHEAGLPLPGQEKKEPSGKQEKNPFFYSEEILKKINSLTTYKIVAEHQVGKYRQAQVVIQNSKTGEVVLKLPPAIEVPYLTTGFFKWLQNQEAQQLHPAIKSAVCHYGIVAIHPFVEGNGRTARAFSTLVLCVEGYNIKNLFALEEYFDRNSDDYFRSLQTVSSSHNDLGQRDLTPWLEYFTTALAMELNRIKNKVQQLSTDVKLKQKLGGKQVHLSERQLRLVEYIQKYGGISMSEARHLLPMVSDDTIWRDFKELIKDRVVKKKGSTKGAYYYLAT